MKRIGLSFLFLLIGMMFSMAQEYELVWFDEFDYSGLPNSDKWNYDIGGGGWGNSELQYYTNRSENARVEGGNLRIEARKEAYSGSAYTSARLVTRNKGDWKYGKIEVRAKLPSGKGSWPAIWMLPTDWAYGGWPASGEIDIMEHVGYDPVTIFGTVHTEAYNHSIGTQKGSSLTVSDCESEYHLYSIIWTEDKIDFYVDNTFYFSFTNQGTWEKWPFDQRFHLILNIAVGGSWGGAQGVDDNIFPTSMYVDYVRVYNEIVELSLMGEDYLLPNENTTFEVNNIVGATYQWVLPSDALILSGATSSKITVQWGQTDGEVKALINRNGEVDTVAKQVLLIEIPAESEYFWSNFADNSLADILPADHSGNQFTLSEADSILRIDYTIADAGLNSYIIIKPERPVYLTDLQNMWLELKTYNKTQSVITRYDLIDIYGKETDVTPVFKIEQPVADGTFHEYSFNFSGRWQSSGGGFADSTKIAALRMYINYGFYGKDNVSDSLWIRNLRMSDVKAGIFSNHTRLEQAKVWPNPATDYLDVQIPNVFNQLKNKTIWVYGLDGSVVLRKSTFNEQERIEIKNLVPGIYRLLISDGEKLAFSYFVKE